MTSPDSRTQPRVVRFAFWQDPAFAETLGAAGVELATIPLDAPEAEAWAALAGPVLPAMSVAPLAAKRATSPPSRPAPPRMRSQRPNCRANRRAPWRSRPPGKPPPP